MNQNPGSMWTNIAGGKFANCKLTSHQVNKLVASINARLLPEQRDEVKCFFVYGEAPSKSTRTAFENAAQMIIQNSVILNAIIG